MGSEQSYDRVSPALIAEPPPARLAGQSTSLYGHPSLRRLLVRRLSKAEPLPNH